MIDSHCHLDRCREKPATLVEGAREAGLTMMLTVGLDEVGNQRQIDMAAEFPEVFACVGRHPNDADGFYEQAAEAIAGLAREPGVVAIGETGLDFYRDTAEPENQRVAFAARSRSLVRPNFHWSSISGIGRERRPRSQRHSRRSIVKARD